MKKIGPALTKSHSDQQRRKPAIPKMKLKEILTAEGISNHQQERVSNSNSIDKEKDKGKIIEDVTDKSAANEKGKLPITGKADQDLVKDTSPKKGVENVASKSDNAEDKQEEKARTAKNITAVRETNHKGTSKIQDLPQPSSVNGSSSSSQMPVSVNNAH